MRGIYEKQLIGGKKKMNELIISHIIPSGSNKTLCGLKQSKKVIGTSLGLACDCKECFEIANKLVKKQLIGDKDENKKTDG